MPETSLNQTPLHDLHLRLGARMVEFAGYEMPVQYPLGVKGEHLHTRARAGLFDVSHMGQVRIDGAGGAAALEALTPGNVLDLKEGRLRYTQFTNQAGGILDDLIITNAGDHLFVVVNAACKDQDIALMEAGLAGAGLGAATLSRLDDRGLIALQGPDAVGVLDVLAPGVAGLAFMSAATFELCGARCFISRSGYTGEDGFEISAPADRLAEIAETLLADEAVEPIGLGARDSLRLEAGLCLYGHDLDPTTTPVEAALEWSIGKRRRAEGGFPGADVVCKQLTEGALRRRVGIRLQGRAPAREGAEIVDSEGVSLGKLTSGGFGPSLNAPVAMGYVAQHAARVGETVFVMVRGKPLPALVVALPFVKANYKRA